MSYANANHIYLPTHIHYHSEVLNNFYLYEMKCKCGCDLIIFQKELLERLNAVRKDYGELIVVNSWTRCKAHNKAEGGKRNSLHLWGKAVDIRPAYGLSIVPFRQLCRIHFPFIKPYASFIHCDTRGHRKL